MVPILFISIVLFLFSFESMLKHLFIYFLILNTSFESCNYIPHPDVIIYFKEWLSAFEQVPFYTNDLLCSLSLRFFAKQT